jgi:WD40 repeat protein
LDLNLQADPGPAPTPTPLPTPNRFNHDWRNGDLIPFEAAKPGHLDRDLFVYNARLDTVLEMVGANSGADESGPVLDADNKLLVFQRTTTGPDQLPHADVLLVNTLAQTVNTLQDLNTEAFDEIAPSVSGDGRWITFVLVQGDTSKLRLFDVPTRTLYEVPAADHQFAQIADPTVSSSGRVLAFAARTRRPDGTLSDLDIYLYDVPSGQLVTPSFVNSFGDEDDPSFSGDDKKLAFDSDRFGTKDLFEADLTTHAVDNLPFLNTAAFDETVPVYYGPDGRWIHYKLFPNPDAAPNDFLLRVYRPETAEIDMLPTVNQLLIGP